MYILCYKCWGLLHTLRLFKWYNSLLTEILVINEKNELIFVEFSKENVNIFLSFKFKKECIFTYPIILLLHFTVVSVSKWNCSQPFIPLHLLYHLTTIYWVNLVSSYDFDWFQKPSKLKSPKLSQCILYSILYYF